ncbi:Nif3-like dinuclear metal center hexameric protein [Solidesulfovibrio sp. C21]|uniref:Nif3-like dinuclear metal center hexameric protein n=1 Tax=Solidesulfovibrio sp. C21 TaxID=3398613 RepID=UPI0039FD1DF6
MRVNDLIGVIERTAVPARAASWDRSGVQIAGSLADCDKLAVALDPTPSMVGEALAWGAQVILTHHPLTLSPRLPDRVDDYHRLLALVLGAKAWLYAAHTSLDTAVDGPPAWLADALDLTDRRILEPAGTEPHWQARWRAAPGKDVALALSALPGVTAHPCVRQVEAVFPARERARVEAALAAVCPEASLISLVALAAPAVAYGYGLVGRLPAPTTLSELETRLAALLPRRFFIVAGDPSPVIASLAYCPGSGADMAPRAFAAGADVYLTGDLKYHQAQSVPPGKCVVDVGHFSLEEVMMRRFADDLAATLGETGPTVRFFPGKDPFAAHVLDGALPSRTE